jgi:hypothetical protein
MMLVVESDEEKFLKLVDRGDIARILTAIPNAKGSDFSSDKRIE